MKTLVVGIGSSHGDDRAGWNAIDQLQHRAAQHIELRHASVPHDLLNWLGGVETLHIVDAYSANGGVPSLLRFDGVVGVQDGQSSIRWQTADGERADSPTLPTEPAFRSGGSHQIGVASVLELALCLEQMPPVVVLWGIPGYHFSPADQLSPQCVAATEKCVEAIAKELLGF